VWVLAVGFALAFGAWLFHHDWAAVFGPLAGEDPRIIAFGDSSLRAATLSSRGMERLARDSGARGLHFIRITQGDAQLHTFLPLLESAIAARPDVLLLDSWILLHPLRRGAEELHRAYQRPVPRTKLPSPVGNLRLVLAANPPGVKRRFLFGWLRDLLGHRDALDPSARRAPPRCRPATWDANLARSVQRWPAGRLEEAPPLVLASAERLLERARTEEVRIVIVDIPRAEPFESLTGVQQKRRLTRELVEAWVADGRVRYLPKDGPGERDHYCDGIHMKFAGKLAFSGWLLRELANEAEGLRSP
jgi:hypothetical protein